MLIMICHFYVLPLILLSQEIMERIKLEAPEYVYKAISIEQFRTASGARRMYQPYWLKKGQGVHLITPDTDVDKFQTQIENGEVFIQEKYFEIPGE